MLLEDIYMLHCIYIEVSLTYFQANLKIEICAARVFIIKVTYNRLQLTYITLGAIARLGC